MHSSCLPAQCWVGVLHPPFAATGFILLCHGPTKDVLPSALHSQGVSAWCSGSDHATGLPSPHTCGAGPPWALPCATQQCSPACPASQSCAPEAARKDGQQLVYKENRGCFRWLETANSILRAGLESKTTTETLSQCFSRLWCEKGRPSCIPLQCPP